MAEAGVSGTPGVDALVSSALGVEVRAGTNVGGGDFASSHRLELADGRTVFAKTHTNPPPNFFSTEAAGLEWLRSSNTVAVPEVLHVSDSPPLLVLEWVDEGRSTDEAAFGRALAALALGRVRDVRPARWSNHRQPGAAQRPE